MQRIIWDLRIFGDTDWHSPRKRHIQSSTSLAQGDLLQEHDRKFAELLDDQKLSKLCSDSGFLKETWREQFFITVEEVSEVVQTTCREYTQPRDLQGWIRQNKKIGPVLDVKIYPHEGCYCIDIMLNPVLITKQFHWFALWMESINTSQKRHKKFPLTSVNWT